MYVQLTIFSLGLSISIGMWGAEVPLQCSEHSQLCRKKDIPITVAKGTYNYTSKENVLGKMLKILNTDKQLRADKPEIMTRTFSTSWEWR